jgi:hypothetical protein
MTDFRATSSVKDATAKFAVASPRPIALIKGARGVNSIAAIDRDTAWVSRANFFSGPGALNNQSIFNEFKLLAPRLTK